MDLIFTIVSRNYAAQAATLMQSVKATEPTARRVVIATDGPIPALEAIAEVRPAETLDAPFAAMSVYYDALELNTAVKPYAFRQLLREAASVTYLDPDIVLFRPLDRVREALASAELALTPHLTRPLLGEAMPDDAAILRSGVYNLGFLAARPTAKVEALMDWWALRCRFDCRVDFEAGFFTDQRWMDLAPGFVDHLAILRDPGLNLAYWNLEGRALESTAQGWTVDGRPLAFFHFSGFDPARPEVLSKHQDRIRVAAGSPLAALLADYAQRLLANGHAEASAIPYAHSRFASGRPVTREMRRQALAAARAGEVFDGLGEATESRLTGGAGLRREPDNGVWGDQPWRGRAAEALDWLRGADACGRPRALSALLAARADLRERFGSDPQGLLAWCLGVEAPAGRFAPDLLPDALIAELATDPGPLLQAARFADPGGSALKQRCAAAFGLAGRGRWPEPAVRGLRRELLAQAVDRPAPFPQLFQDIWDSRTDLQRQFPLATRIDRFRYLRWLIGAGLAEYDVAFDHLPDPLKRHPGLQLARLTLGRAPERPAASGAAAAELWVVEGAEAAQEAAADRLVYEAAAGRFLGPAGAPAAPAEVARLRFLTDPGLVPADAIALHARGVRWGSAIGAWSGGVVAALSADNLALGFVDEVIGASRDDLPRPARALAVEAA